ncbi:metalloprotease TIKI1, partial [Trichonephila clavata]
VLFALNQSLVRLEELRNGRPSPFSGTEDLVRHYNCRNLTYASFTNPDMLSDSGNASDELLSKNINQYFRQELIEKRNARMAHRVLQLLRQYPDESFFFAFGTGTIVFLHCHRDRWGHKSPEGVRPSLGEWDLILYPFCRSLVRSLWTLYSN